MFFSLPSIRQHTVTTKNCNCIINNATGIYFRALVLECWFGAFHSRKRKHAHNASVCNQAYQRWQRLLDPDQIIFQGVEKRTRISDASCVHWNVFYYANTKFAKVQTKSPITERGGEARGKKTKASSIANTKSKQWMKNWKPKCALFKFIRFARPNLRLSVSSFLAGVLLILQLHSFHFSSSENCVMRVRNGSDDWLLWSTSFAVMRRAVRFFSRGLTNSEVTDYNLRLQ